MACSFQIFVKIHIGRFKFSAKHLTNYYMASPENIKGRQKIPAGPYDHFFIFPGKEN